MFLELNLENEEITNLEKIAIFGINKLQWSEGVRNRITIFVLTCSNANVLITEVDNVKRFFGWLCILSKSEEIKIYS